MHKVAKCVLLSGKEMIVKKIPQVNLGEGGLVPNEGGDMGDVDLVRHALRYSQYLGHQYCQYLVCLMIGSSYQQDTTTLRPS